MEEIEFSEEVIQREADMLEWSLEELIQQAIDALKTFAHKSSVYP